MSSSTNVDFHKCEIMQLSSYANNPSNLFGYRRLDFYKDIQYEEISSSQESGVDATKAAKASEGRTSFSNPQAQGAEE